MGEMSGVWGTGAGQCRVSAAYLLERWAPTRPKNLIWARGAA